MKKLTGFGRAIAAAGLLLAASAANASITFNDTQFDFYTSCTGNVCDVSYVAAVGASSSYIGNHWEGASLQMESGAPGFVVSNNSVFANATDVTAGFGDPTGGKADANGCDNILPPGVCLDWGDDGSNQGGGPTIAAGDVFTWSFTVTFDSAFDWTYSPNLKFLTVRYNAGAGKWQQNGGLVSMSIGVPEPGTLALLGLGLAGLGFAGRRRKI